MSSKSTVGGVGEPELARVAEYFAVVGTHPSTPTSISVPVPSGCLRCPPELLDIDEPQLPNETPPPDASVDFSDTESDLQSLASDLDGEEAAGPIQDDGKEIPRHCAVSLRNIWRMAIVEIGVVFHDKGETVPDGYEVLAHTVSGEHEADLNAGLNSYKTSIVFKRRGSGGRPDHITDIQLVTWSSSKAPPGYTVLKNTVSLSYDASLSRGTYGNSMYLCYRRNSRWDEEETLYNGEPSIGEIIVVNKTKGELPPHGAQMLNKNINRGTMSGNDVYIGIFKDDPTGICDIPYESFTIDRYPQADYDDFALPVNELPMFIFPHGLHLQRKPHTNAPMPSFFPFVFTGLNGERIHVACLTFYEELSEEVVEKLKTRHRRIHANFSQELQELRGSRRSLEKSPSSTSSASSPAGYVVKYGVYAPKCITIISRFPFYRALRRFLRQLYRISLSAAPAPLERYISYVVTWLPVPKNGGRAFHVHLESPTLDDAGRAGYSLAPIALALPPMRSLPPMDLDFNGPFRSLSVVNVLNIFALLLQESQVLFLSTRASLVTEVCETFLSLLFPLQWQCCYVPRLPDDLAACLDYPGGFVLGMHLVQNEGRRENAEMKGGKEREGVDVAEFLSNLSLQETVHVVDLDMGTVSRAGGFGKLGSSYFRTQPYKTLPSFPMMTLKRKLEDELKRVGMVAGRGDGLIDYDSAFEFAPTPDIQERLAAHGITDQNMNADVIRDAFLVFMADTMGSYQQYLIPPKMKKPNNFGGGDLNNFLNVDAFLASADRADRMSSSGGGRHDFLKGLFETQMFSCLVQQRTESSVNDNRLVFFEEVVNLFQRIKAQLEMDSDDESYQDLSSVSRNDNNPLQGAVAPEKRALANLFNSPESVANLQYLVKGTREKDKAGSKHNVGFLSGAGGDQVPKGLILQLVHEELGNFLKGNDFKELDEMLIENRISEVEDRPSDLIEAKVMTPQQVQNASREDKGCDADTSVSVSKRKPLQIPGPSSDGIKDKVRNEKEGGGDRTRRRAETTTAERQWSYPTGWPTPLEPSFFEYPEQSLPPLLSGLRRQALEQRNQNKRLILTRSADEMTRSGRLDYDLCEAIHSCVQVFGCYFLCVPTQLAHLQGAPVRVMNKLFLKALGALKRLDFIGDKGSLDFTDEAMWRSLLIGAGRIGGAKMAEVSSALFTEMKRAGITPNAVTYGLYTQALATSEKRGKGKKGGRSDGRSSPGPLMRGTSVGALSEGGRESPRTYVEEEDDTFASLEVEGYNWRAEKCIATRGRGLTNMSGGVSMSTGGSLESSLRVSSPPPAPPHDSFKVVRPPSPPSRVSSFGSNDNADALPPVPLGGVGMWLTCVCPECGREMLEEDILSNLLVSGTGLAQKMECLCGAPLSPILNYSVHHLAPGKGKHRPGSSPGLNCAGPAAMLGLSGVGVGNLSGLSSHDSPKDWSAGSSVAVVEKESGQKRFMASVMVRSKLERLLIRDGEHMLTRDVLRKEEEGEVYWNLVWYCARFGLPVPLAQTSGEAPGPLPNFLKEITVVGLNERTVHERLSNRLLSAVECWADGGERGSEAFELERWNVEIDWLFGGINENERRGLNEVRNLLMTGNIEGTVPEGGWTNGFYEKEEESKADAGGKRGSFIRRLSLNDNNNRRGSLAAPNDPSKLPTPGKRVHDAIQLCCRFRSEGTFRPPSEFKPLSNLYHILLLIAGTYEPDGMKVVTKKRSDEGRSEFDALYIRAISRLSLMQQEQLDQTDRDLHNDISTLRSAEFRNAFGFI